MTTADQLAIVEAKLADADAKAVVLADGGLVQGWMKTRRLLVLVQQRAAAAGGTHAVFVFVAASFPVAAVADLAVESVLPVDQDFRCEIDSGDAVLINISGGAPKTKLMFEMLPGYHTQNFVAEVYRLTDAVNARQRGSGDRAQDFSWALRHLPRQQQQQSLGRRCSLVTKER
jgi:phosphatidylinositol-bisphosphatase